MSFKNVARPHAASFAILRRDDGKVAFVLRSHTGWMDDHYALPAGKVEKGETFTQAAVREAFEEADVKINPQDTKAVLTCYRNANDDTEAWLDVFFEVSAWEGEPYNAEPHVHGELTWLDPFNLPPNVVPYYPEVFEHIRAGRAYFEYDWK